ncbi:MAG: hypothetical protein K6C07_04265, partial [Bacteroidales bacterium]|nr:hypothetical protein [Bacteroidales bacterium]
FECKNNQFSDTFAHFFGKKINLAHIKLISLFIMALCKARTVCFSKLAACFDSPASASSCLRRIQRFYAKHTLDSDIVARLIFRLLPIMGPLQLAIDRTNWQFGKTAINIFMLAVVHDAATFPLLSAMLHNVLSAVSVRFHTAHTLTAFVSLLGTTLYWREVSAVLPALYLNVGSGCLEALLCANS